MLTGHLRRGAAVGLAGGVAYGLFVALVGRPSVARAEAYEAGTAEAVTSPMLTAVGSVVGGVAWGLLLGFAVFGVGYFLLEPAIPGTPPTKSFLLGFAGFLTVSGAPWLGLPPQPPGVEQGLPAETRLLWYGILAVSGALACFLSGGAFGRLRGRPLALRLLAAATPFVLLAVPVLAMPENPTTGTVPDGVVAGFRLTVVAGQVGLWLLMAGAHAWLTRRAGIAPPVSGEATVAE